MIMVDVILQGDDVNDAPIKAAAARHFAKKVTVAKPFDKILVVVEFEAWRITDAALFCNAVFANYPVSLRKLTWLLE
jgi:hypothetical protein